MSPVRVTPEHQTKPDPTVPPQAHPIPAPRGQTRNCKLSLWACAGRRPVDMGAPHFHANARPPRRGRTRQCKHGPRTCAGIRAEKVTEYGLVCEQRDWQCVRTLQEQCHTEVKNTNCSKHGANMQTDNGISPGKNTGKNTDN